MPDDQEKKIVVDDDWKERVRKEREELRNKDKTEEGDGGEAPAESSATQDSAPANEQSGGDAGPKPPPATLEGLISMLAAQAMVSMGVMPGPDGDAKVDRVFAKHFIDLLGILEEKTKGNLTDDESKMLTQVLHDLRMGYVQLPA